MSNLFHNVLGTVLLDVSLGHHYRPEQLVLGSLVAHLSGHLLSGDPRVMGREGGWCSFERAEDGWSVSRRHPFGLAPLERLPHVKLNALNRPMDGMGCDGIP